MTNGLQASGASESMSRTSSGSRIPMAMAKSSAKNSVPQSGTSPDTTVPAMWRSNSYEGTTQAYIATSQSGKDLASRERASPSATSNSQPGQPQVENALTPTAAIGIDGLRQLENDPAVTGVSDAASIVPRSKLTVPSVEFSACKSSTASTAVGVAARRARSHRSRRRRDRVGKGHRRTAVRGGRVLCELR